MAPIIPPDDLQQAWQTAFQLRTCPDDAVLRAPSPDVNLNRHLAACSICREKRAMPVEQVKAWHNLFSKFAPLVHQAVNTSQPGQVWVLKKKLSRWGDDGYYYSPPNVLLLEKLDDKHGYRAAQLYFDKRLMGEGDVWLGDRFGFAQGWNSYTIHQDMLECWLGNATDSQLSEVIYAGALNYAPLDEYSILSFFRKLEITVGSYVSVPSVFELVEEMENATATESVLDYCKRLFSYDAIQNALHGWKLPQVTEDVFQLLTSAIAPLEYAPLAASGKLAYRQFNHVRKQNDGVYVEPVLIEISFSEWQGDGYLVSGKLTKPFLAPVQVLANLTSAADTRIDADLFTIAAGDLTFDLFFSGATREDSLPENLQILLVSHAQS